MPNKTTYHTNHISYQPYIIMYFSPVSPDDLKRALSLADPEITSQQMDSYLAWAFRVPPETVYDCNPLEQATILQRLENGNVFRVGQKM